MTRRALLVGVLSGTAFAQRSPESFVLDASGPVPYYIHPGAGIRGSLATDAVLAEWALAAWARAAGGRLRFRRAAEPEALLRIYWVDESAGLYGEMRPLQVNGRRGAAVFITPDTDGLGPDIGAEARRDPLFRETVVYLTCLHEIGHGLGLQHTSDFADIMYFFGYGGDVPGFFRRYRRLLQTRDDIPQHAGLSRTDVERVRRLYGVNR
jgi:hypothetical protein